MTDKEMARGLGVASLAIGLTEIAAPKQIENLMGIRNGQNTGILRVLGVREIMHGVDILSHDDPTPGLWARVAGDMLDGVLLGFAAKSSRRKGGWLAVCAMVLPIVIADMFLAGKMSAKK